MELIKVSTSPSIMLTGRIQPSRFRDILPTYAREADLEQLIIKYPGLLNMGQFDPNAGDLAEDLLIIEQQPRTVTQRRADLFALDREGNLVIIEVKRDVEDARARHEPIEFQAIRYAASSRRMSSEDVINMFARYLQRLNAPDVEDESERVWRERAVDRIIRHLEDEDESLSEDDLHERIDPRATENLLGSG